jgi:hypothetical protein
MYRFSMAGLRGWHSRLRWPPTTHTTVSDRQAVNIKSGRSDEPMRAPLLRQAFRDGSVRLRCKSDRNCA